MGKGIRWLSVMVSAAAIALSGVVFLSLVAFLNPEGFLSDLTVHFRVQYLGLSLALTAFFVWQRRRWAWLLSLFCLVVNLALVSPWYWPLPSAHASDGSIFRVVVSNIEGNQNQNYPPLITLLRREKPDFLFLLESNRPWLNALDELREQFPYTLNRSNTHPTDVAIYSRWPLQAIAPAALQAVEEDVIVARFERDGVPGMAIAIHPPPPISRQRFIRRNQVLREVAQYVQQLQAENALGSDRIILGGDFNITMWSTFYRQLRQTTGLKNIRDGFGVLPSWPTYLPPVSIPIDHCLVSPQIPVLDARIGPHVGSDHLPVIVDLGGEGRG